MVLGLDSVKLSWCMLRVYFIVENSTVFVFLSLPAMIILVSIVGISAPVTLFQCLHPFAISSNKLHLSIAKDLNTDTETIPRGRVNSNGMQLWMSVLAKGLREYHFHVFMYNKDPNSTWTQSHLRGRCLKVLDFQNITNGSVCLYFLHFIITT